MIDDLDRLEALSAEGAKLAAKLDSLNGECRNLAVDLYRRGVPHGDVVRAAQVSNSTLSAWLRDAGITPTHAKAGRGRKRPDDVRERAVAAALNRAEGVTMDDVATEFGVHKVTLHRWVDAARAASA